MGNKKILHIIDNLWLGWAQRVIEWIFSGQMENKNIFLFSLRETKNSTKIQHENIFIHDSKNKFSFPILQLRSFILENKIEVLHCHLAKSQILGWILKKIFFPKITLVFHEHGEIFEDGKIYPFFMNLLRYQVNLYIAVSEATKRKILKKTYFWDEKIGILYNFVDENKFRKIDNFDKKQQREMYKLEVDDFVVWFASRLYEGKWYMDFLMSAKYLLEKKQNLKFVIAGEGEWRKNIIDFIETNNLLGKILLIWYTENMTNFYNMIDCFVFPSHRESLWITGIEANACGTPVIASNIEWLNEIMIHGKNSLLFEKQNSQDLSEKIICIFENEDFRKTLIQNGIQEIQKYTLSKYLVDLNKLYENIK